MQGYGLFPGLVWQLPKSSHSFYFISFPVAGHLQKDCSEAKEIKLLHQDFDTGLVYLPGVHAAEHLTPIRK